LQEKRIKGKGNPWLNEEVLRAIKERGFLKKTVSYSKRESDWVKYKKSRNKVNRIKNKIKGSYYKHTFRELRDKPKELWKKVREFMPNSQITNKVVSLPFDDNSLYQVSSTNSLLMSVLN